ncbi:MAG: phosphoribosylanthranilate isomerase [Ruminococcaceae bacterium]|jgi:phosphoribosylanthranilate isomerase|nr:phosphoribosylanthranilate isomerase [Oscillospiraceae bacterium]HCA69493.1 N-(5'-phosphoribosyl)anthranilate isomerase [Lachnospiraceae bacterium]
MTKVKLCGLTRECDIEYANRLLPDYIGFVFAEKSRRYVSSDRAKTLKRLLNTRISPVGVFVNEPVERVALMLNQRIIDLAQLHGQEDEAYIGKLRALTDKPIIKAFSVASVSDLSAAEKSSADYILFDNDCGGTGKSFNWNLLASFQRPFFLAGGISPKNIKTALTMVHPYAIDVSSGIETDGVKDYNKIERLMQAVRKD